jgi:hypothetical protein
MSQFLDHRRNSVRLRQIDFIVVLSLLVLAPLDGQSPNGTMGPITAVVFEDTCGNLINLAQPET